MKIAIIGGGASGMYLSLLLKQKYHFFDINVYEASSKILTKLKAAGNGKCNINNKIDDINSYNHPDFVEKHFSTYDINIQLNELKNLGILVKELSPNCLYPISESGDNVKRILTKKANDLGVKIFLDKCFKSYEIIDDKITIKFFDDEVVNADALVFASGTHASTRDDKSYIVFNELKRHGYILNELKPALCPIKVKENVKKLAGCRIKGIIKANNKEEKGEILFKNDGLSGISIFNISLTFARQKVNSNDISIFTLDKNELNDLQSISISDNDPLLSVYPLEVANYVYDLASSRNIQSLKQIIVAGLKFTYKGNYDANNAHICVGGVSLDNLNHNTLESKLEKNVFFMGEMMDIDGYCGGFNLKWALVSALIVRDSIKK